LLDEQERLWGGDDRFQEVQASVARSLQAFTATHSKNHGYLVTFFLSLPHSQPYFWLNFLPFLLPLFHTDPAVAGVFAVEVVASPACVPCLRLAFLLLLGSLLMPTSLLLLAFLLLLGCHTLVSDCMAHSYFHGHQFSMESGHDNGHLALLVQACRIEKTR
jgi:hypothetical protein